MNQNMHMHMIQEMDSPIMGAGSGVGGAFSSNFLGLLLPTGSGKMTAVSVRCRYSWIFSSSRAPFIRMGRSSCPPFAMGPSDEGRGPLAGEGAGDKDGRMPTWGSGSASSGMFSRSTVKKKRTCSARNLHYI